MNQDNSEPGAKLEQLKHAYALEYEMIRATAAFEQAALRPLFLLNGGALVVYLGLFGALRKNTANPEAVLNFAYGQWAIYAWIVGLLLATLTAILGALSQASFRKQRGREV